MSKYKPLHEQTTAEGQYRTVLADLVDACERVGVAFDNPDHHTSLFFAKSALDPEKPCNREIHGDLFRPIIESNTLAAENAKLRRLMERMAKYLLSCSGPNAALYELMDDYKALKGGAA